MLEPSHQSDTPPGGWSYTEDATSLTIKSLSLIGLMKKVRIHRSANGLPIWGNWVKEVYHKICTQNPSTPCHDIERPDKVFTPEDVWRFLTTLKEKFSSGEQMVDEPEQLRRMEICRTCPKKGHIACRWCGPLGEMLSSFVAGRKLPKIDDVFKTSCLACGCDITSKTAFPLKVLQDVDAQLGTNPDYAPQCWMRDQTL